MTSIKIKEVKNNKKDSNVYTITSVYSEEKKTVKDLIKELLASKSKYVS
jgi:hypothetical protein